ncbi:MAG: cupin domain-containing protein [Methanomicrobiales archaeon]
MKRLLLCVAIALLLAAGCLTPGTPPAGGSRLQILSPSEPFPLFEGEGVMTEIITGETPILPMNFSLGYVVIDPGNGTPPHRLLPTSELIYVDAGTARVRCDHGTVTAEREELVLIPESVLQSIDSVGDAQLRYVSAIQPPYSDEIEIAGDALHSCGIQTDSVPIVVRDPGEGIEWDFDTGTVIYTLINPVLMPEKEIPIDYSVAFAEIRPGGHVVKNRLIGRTEVLYVIEGEIEISSPGDATIRVPAGSAGYIPPGCIKEYRNSGEGNAQILSFVDPAWTLEGSELLD